MKKMLLGFVAFLLAEQGTAQYVSGLGEVEDIGSFNAKANSPEASANLVEVDLFTGRLVPEINLFQKTVDGVELPLKLLYQSNGFKPNELTSIWGLGWNLSCGYGITRVIKGNADDINQYEVLPNTARELQKGYRNSPIPAVPLTSAQEKDYLVHNYDSELDLFSLMLNGEKIDFVIGKDGVPKILSGQLVDIAYTTDSIQNRWFNYSMENNSIFFPSYSNLTGITRFIVTDENGNEFHFASQNRIMKILNAFYGGFVPGPNPGMPQIDMNKLNIAAFFFGDDAWELVKIKTRNSNEITLEYDAPVFQILKSAGNYVASAYTGGICYSFPSNVPAPSASQPNDYNLLLFYTGRVLHPLKRIDYGNGLTINFSYKNRSNCNGTNAVIKNSLCIDKVEVRVNNSTKYGYRFNHSYYDRNAAGQVSAYNNCNNAGRYFQEDANIYLRLDGIEIFPESLNLRYDFSYWMNPDNLIPIKGAANSAVVDHWGYFNNRNSGSYGFVPSTDGLGFNLINGADRTPNAPYALTGMLKTIKKNNNAEITYEYEGNEGFLFDPGTQSLAGTVSAAGGLRIKKITSYDGISHQNDIIKTYDYRKENSTVSSGMIFCKPAYSKPFTCNQHGAATYLKDYSLTQAQGFLYNGAACGYSTVTVAYGAGGEGGKEVYNFSNILETDGTKNIVAMHNQLSPFAHVQYLKDWKMGLLNNKKTFAYQQSVPKLEEKYEYAVSEGELQPVANYTSVKFELIAGPHEGLNKNNLGENFDWQTKVYQPWAAWSRLVKKRDVALADDGQLITTVEDYTYDVLGNLKTIKRTASNDDVLETRIYRAYDYNPSANSALANLIGSARKTTIIRTDNLIQKQGTSQQNLIQTSIKNYVLINGINNMPLPVVSGTYELYATTPVPQNTVAFDPGSVVPASTAIRSYNLFSYKNNGYLHTSRENEQTQAVLYSGTQVIATARYAAEQDIACSSFESASSEGYWDYNNGSVNSTDFYTGRQSCSGTIQLAKQLDFSKTFEISLWVKGGIPIVVANTASGNSPLNVTLTAYETHNGWTLYKGRFSGKATCSINTGGLIDELRLYPVGATVKTMVQDPLYGPISICDENDKALYYEYDPTGNLVIVRDQDRNIIRKTDVAVQKPE